MGRLIHIEIDNFKSYKGNHVIGPFHNFTCVMGPNGSGKSNLMDAISFVLGVDSHHLRSQNIKDLIYRTMQNQPEDQISTAFVLALFETSSGEHLEFKRTANSDGSSVYSINGTRSSYADYNTALEGQGIMAKAMNFLVFQGDIEAVASRNPMELTKLMERISGSVEFKGSYEELKAEYERAMEEASHALQLKRGVNLEAKQHRQLKAEAEEHDRLAREYKELQARFLLWELYHVEQGSKETENKIAELTLTTNDATKEKNDLEDKYQAVRKEQAIVHRERTRKELEIKKISLELTEVSRSKQSLKDKLEHANTKIKQIAQSGQLAERDLAQQNLEVQKIENDLSLAKKEEGSYDAHLAQSSIGHGPTLTPEQQITYDELKRQVTLQALKEKEQLVLLQQQRKLLAQRLEQENDKRSVLEESAQRYKKTRQQVVDNGEALTEEQQRVSNRLEGRANQLKFLEQERLQLEQQEAKINTQLQDILDQLLQANIHQQETRKNNQLEEALTMMKQLFPGVRGQLSNLCKPTQRKYGVAVSTVLGRNMDAFVVDDQKTAMDCIRYLREQRLGTGVFLPLDSLSPPAINDRLRNLPRSRLAIDVIQCDRAYQPAVQYACENTVVCDNLAVAKRVCFEMNEDVKAVTLDGNVIHRSGLMTGGAEANANTKDWDAKDVEGLTRSRDKLLAQLNDLARNKRMALSEENAKRDCETLQKQLDILSDDIKIAEQALRDTDTTAAQNDQLLATSKARVEEISRSLATLEQELAGAQAALATVEDQVFAEFCQTIGVPTIRDYEEVSLKLPEQAREQKKTFKLQQSRLEAQLAFERQQAQDIQDRVTDLTAKLRTTKDSVNQHQQEDKDLDQRILDLQVASASNETALAERQVAEQEKKEELQAIRGQLEASGADAAKYLKEMDKLERALEKLQAERSSIFRKCKLEEIEFPLLRGSMEDVLMDTDESSNLTLSQDSSMEIDQDMSCLSIQSTDWVVEVDYSVLDDEERGNATLTMKKRYQEDLLRRKRELDASIPNLKSVERLETIERDLEKMADKYQAARKTLDEVKEKFNQVKRQRQRRFQDAFTHVSERIDDIYKELTRSTLFPAGGKAYLTLEDSDEPYLHGIMYHAMPPMKRFQDMTQLSGGEKSMAALALVFAIRSFQQSPFFVMDEVDAALDNANVKQLANYIQRHASDQLQFIMISFKTMMYEQGDSLVGVYRLTDSNCSGTPVTLKLDEYSS
ncbi:RecF/RecN/SMC protein [Hesseltinella vesiculosa]|uniref:Structural maintenance of chromosomes protein n=1 Tax=Hesseltinella vesiculosa TaxID=101127 RepID=A0A1X2G2K3_9FUNG|nr:RecF/RecN/SMC protein [Hesseltinella vesiculosa]